MFKKYKHSRLALLIIVALALLVGYACGLRHGTARSADDQSKASRATQQTELRMWSV